MFRPVYPIAGQPPFNDWFTPDTTQRVPLGQIVIAHDQYWGGGEFMYVKSADALIKGSLTMYDELYNGVLLPTTAGQGFPFGVAMNAMASGVYGWIQITGFAVYKTNATVAADTVVAVAAAGIVGALANGKQLLGVRNRKAATATKTVSAGTIASNGVLTTSGFDGFFLGMALSGTGIPASTVVAALDPDGRRIYTGSAIGTLGDKNSTATGTVTVTGTYTGYGAGMINRPFAQGQVA